MDNPKLEIIGGSFPSSIKVSLDGKEIQGITHLQVNMGTGELPSIALSINLSAVTLHGIGVDDAYTFPEVTSFTPAQIKALKAMLKLL